MRPSPRDRITIELRGMRERLQRLAAARKTTTSALARQALVSLLDGESGNADYGTREATTSCGDPVVKLTLRLPAAHAVALATRARAADVSQGAFVAALMDGNPPASLPRDHADAVAAVVASTDQLAVMCTDINALMRLAKIGAKEEVQSYRARVSNLVDDVRSHLAVVAPLVATLKLVRRAPAKSAQSQRQTP
jgi:hypothetical protein